MILGTAGHVDHGKTALVKALTGVDTDRLEEEKRRGITIDLGFAPLRIADGVTIGVVDVPGHEAFVRNMLAGATGVDLALLVVAADEGVMPQTREHLAILSLLGVRAGVIAITKTDLVDEEWLDLVREDVRSATVGTPLEGAAVVPTSAATGTGIDAVRAAIRAAAEGLGPRDAEDLFRLPVDRAFTVRGTGTVVTGTVWSGTLAREQVVALHPGGLEARVRGLETHGAPVPEIRPGTRAAVALAGVDVTSVRRGMTLVGGIGWSDSSVLLAEVTLLPSTAVRLGPRTAVRFHLGTAEVGARVVTRGGALEPGGRKQARVALDQPVLARAGDRFVIRTSSPLVTIGGGVVNDPAPLRSRPRPWERSAIDPAERLRRALEASGRVGVPSASLAVQLGAPPREVARLTDAAGVRRIGDRLYRGDVVVELAGELERLVERFHAESPLEPGAPLSLIRSQLGTDGVLAETVLRERVTAGALEAVGALVRRPGWAPRLTSEQASLRDRIEAALRDSGREPPSVAELEAVFGADTLPLLRNLERSSAVVQVESDRYYPKTTLDTMVSELRRRMKVGTEYGPAEIREFLGSTRKYLIPFLEYCDRTGITERRTGGRVIVA